MKFSIDEKIRVKLTPMGHAIHKATHMKRYHDYLPESTPPYVPVDEDSEGFSTWQFWDLMREFGEHIYNGADLPFDKELELVKNQDWTPSL